MTRPLNELSVKAHNAKTRGRRPFMSMLGGAVVALAGAGTYTAADRATARNCRAAMGDGIDREIDEASRHVGRNVLALLRDVHAIPVAHRAQEGLIARGSAASPALDILKALIKDLEATPGAERSRFVSAILYVAAILPNKSLFAALHALAQLPDHIHYRILADDAAVLTTFAEHLKKQSDLATMLAEMRAETARRQCESDAAYEALQSCGARRRKSWFPFR
jgi:hypothetical protein